MAANIVQVVMGAAQIGPERSYTTISEVRGLLDVLKQHKIATIDTAQLYTGSEQLLGEADAGEEFTFDTKAFGGFKPGTLKSELMVKEAADSLKKLKVKQVDVFYIHSPDPDADIADYLSGIQKIYEKGTFRRFGLSNFKAEDVEKIYNHCKSRGYVLPTVYQGNYNAVARKQEKLLFPTLRKLNMAFHAYSPIAGGFLTKTREEVTAGDEGAGRFAKGGAAANMYRDMYARESILETLEVWEDLAKREGIPRAEMAYRWIRFHSSLKGEYNDKIIIGARTPDKVDETLKSLENGPLSEECVHGIEGIWEIIEERGEAPLDNYHR